MTRALYPAVQPVIQHQLQLQQLLAELQYHDVKLSLAGHCMGHCDSEKLGSYLHYPDSG